MAENNYWTKNTADGGRTDAKFWEWLRQGEACCCSPVVAPAGHGRPRRQGDGLRANPRNGGQLRLPRAKRMSALTPPPSSPPLRGAIWRPARASIELSNRAHQ